MVVCVMVGVWSGDGCECVVVGGDGCDGGGWE